MTQRIQKLSPLLINQIAAGEVVTRPASVVKELLENAIDAGATHIRIDIEQGGLGLIQISDNGHGIHPDDITLAVTRHATSKLADVGELAGIDSLGFRGEALASIAAVSHLTLASSHDDTGIGQQLCLSGSEVSQATIRPLVKSRGTTVSVRDLYYNVPARRSHLKTIATEFAQIEQVVQRLAISFADIEITLYHQDKLRFSLSKIHPNPNENAALNRLEQALNQPLSQIAEPFFLSLQGLQHQNLQHHGEARAQINGWLFVDENQHLPKLIYINHRLVSDLAISQALQKVARQLGLGQDNALQMGYALFFELPSDWINVNIHPSKQQVKIQPLTNMLAWLTQAVQDTLKPKIDDILARNAVKTVAKTADEKSILANSNLLKPTIAEPLLAKNFNEPTPSSTPKHWQVNEHRLAYDFENVKQNFSVTSLFDNSPKFLKIVENDKGLIFWQDNFYLIALDLLTQDVLANEEEFKAISKHFERLDFERLAKLLRNNDEN